MQPNLSKARTLTVCQFNDGLLCDGEAGGRRASAELLTAITRYLEKELVDVPIGARILCRIYANVRGLADVLVRTGVISHVGVFEDFVRGFTRGKTLFDFIDVGAGKDRADDKIIGEWTSETPSFCHTFVPNDVRIAQGVL